MDVRERASVAVIGNQVRDKMFENEDPVGKELRLGGYQYLVVGVLAKQGGTALTSRDNIVLVPITTLLKQRGGRARSIDITVLARDPARLQQAQEEAELILKLHRGLKPYAAPNYDVMTAEQLYSLYQGLTKGIYGLLLGIVSLILLIGGIVIMNIMLVSVRERTREIGIRKAVGARGRDIMVQFLVEALVLSLTGGLIGVAFGVAASALIGTLAGWGLNVSPSTVVLAVGFSLAVGVVFGVWPARQAARLDPITALRYE
jgi:putative ABC transport system permease protein